MRRRQLFSPTPQGQSEADRQDAVIKYLRLREWCVKITHSTMYSVGWPDLYAGHLIHGTRWIEMKKPGEHLRETQIEFITDFMQVGIFVWVLTDATPEEYAKLFKKSNWCDFL